MSSLQDILPGDTSTISVTSLRSLNNRNTKNLSLDLEETVPNGSFASGESLLTSADDDWSLNMSRPLTDGSIRPQLRSKHQTSLNIKNSSSSSSSSPTLVPHLMSRKSESAIYTVPSLYGRNLSPSSSSPSSSISSSSSSSYSGGVTNGNIGPQRLTRDDLSRNSLSINTSVLNTETIINRNGSQAIFPSVMETGTPLTSTRKNLWVFSNNSIRSNNNDNTNSDFIQQEVYKENAYPEGPLLVVEPNIYLYSEPSLETISKFDIVINVAKEIPNLKSSIPNDSSIDYYQIPWTHNSKILSELNHITKIMHIGVIQNKKILIHCQCGVSRSASLVVAYIMRYRNLGLNEAYDQLKLVATDISPNMGLIFQLMEWGELLKKLDPNNVSTLNSQSLSSPQIHDNSFLSSSSTTNLSSSIDIPETPSETYRNNSFPNPNNQLLMHENHQSIKPKLSTISTEIASYPDGTANHFWP
ncbi:hypothetical protein Kpol_1039p25 [Vanderwaltozyma polyspora DSM 70294]|uniref:protein-tyrosine-phosphatase n=1 Tax=Vanderwaltozyma polyspora (strain ATCC 22028 / DSM 70294 / BCRC 21397 / CBS 2163 / NBRC 10782 / NRRL Y-8283 / UCD 57-17) TaxID=436907 RepID=A7THF2_VANPO|nr:uncharacterized protein Kpol_1039p25 [Vanderwaltozyma polyspora DSM 70294]EDO18276.1 hypothetical protein Kpol_1039p25 [Vanderwaltozyma polyspora DSM 70294]